MSKNNDDKIKKLERQIIEIGEELQQLTSLQHEFLNHRVIPTDRIWNCEKC